MAELQLSNLLIFRNLLNDQLIRHYDLLAKKYSACSDPEDREIFSNEYYNLCGMLFKCGFDSIGDYISYKILSDENIFSLRREKGLEIDEKVKKAVLHDISVLKKAYELPLKGMADKAGDTNSFVNYLVAEELTEVFKSKRPEDIYSFISDEFQKYGCGEYRNNYAFSINDSGEIVKVDNFNPVAMENIYGYESQKGKIIKNTEKFLKGQFALNALLVGDSGTGKSTTVKALIPKYAKNKLRLLEVDKKNLHFISKIIEILKNRGMYFIVFIDDLSFESNDSSYKYLKSAVEGSIYEQPSNILFYVTSNRKHLIKESMIERQNEVHIRDAINEQTSLADRFGLTILYTEPNQNEYFEIVLGLAEKYRVNYESKEQLLADAKKYALQNGGRTGRSAVQFVKTYN